MGWLEMGLLASLVFVLYAFQQMKIILKKNGLPVDLLSGWLKDYRAFKQLATDEPDPKLKAKYQGILNGLFLAIGGAVVLLYMLWQKSGSPPPL